MSEVEGSDKKLVRTYQYVPMTEVEPLFNRLRNAGISPEEATVMVGFSSGYEKQIRAEGKARKLFFWALKGLLAEKAPSGHHSKDFTLDYDEAEALFGVIARIRKVSPTLAADPKMKKLSSRLALHMGLLAEKGE